MKTQAGGHTEIDVLCNKYSMGLSECTEQGSEWEASCRGLGNKLGYMFEYLKPFHDTCAAGSSGFSSLAISHRERMLNLEDAVERHFTKVIESRHQKCRLRGAPLEVAKTPCS